MTIQNNTINYKDYIKQNNIKTTSEFEEYLKDIHSKHYMGTVDDMSDNFDTWLSKLDTSELIYYADDFKNLAEQSIVDKQIEKINKFMPELKTLDRKDIIEILSINNKEK